MTNRTNDTPAADHLVLYDDDCGFCRWSPNWILRWDRQERLAPVAIQSEEGARLLAGLDPARWLDSWHLVRPGGEVLSAGAAGIALAAVLPIGRPLSWVLARFPRSTERAYAAIAGNRDRISRLLGIESTSQVRR